MSHTFICWIKGERGWWACLKMDFQLNHLALLSIKGNSLTHLYHVVVVNITFGEALLFQSIKTLLGESKSRIKGTLNCNLLNRILICNIALGRIICNTVIVTSPPVLVAHKTVDCLRVHWVVRCRWTESIMAFSERNRCQINCADLVRWGDVRLG